jgi:signal transduction histidine kinase
MDMAGGNTWHDVLDRWERREEPIFAALPYGLLALSLLLSVFARDDGSGPLAVDAALAATALIWQLALVGPWVPWRANPRVVAVFYVGLLVLLAALVIHAPWFGFFAFSGYLYLRFLPRGRWVALGIVATATIVATSQAGGLPGTSDGASWIAYGVLIFVNVTVAGLISWLAFVGDQQKERSRQTVDELTETNRRLEDALGENAALQAQLVAQAREAGVLDERQRLAGEIHDTLAQSLAGIVTQLEAAQGAADPDRERRITTAAALAREGLSEARRSVHALRPEPLEAARLPDALAEVAHRWSDRQGVSAEMTTTGDPLPLRPEIEVALLRTAQEALANVAKHARAHRVALTLSYMGDVVTLDVRDDGMGFDPAARNGNGNEDDGGGFGLEAMRRRVLGLAGTLDVESEPGGGTAVSARMPALPAAAGAPR